MDRRQSQRAAEFRGASWPEAFGSLFLSPDACRMSWLRPCPAWCAPVSSLMCAVVLIDRGPDGKLSRRPGCDHPYWLYADVTLDVTLGAAAVLRLAHLRWVHPHVWPHVRPGSRFGRVSRYLVFRVRSGRVT